MFQVFSFKLSNDVSSFSFKFLMMFQVFSFKFLMMFQVFSSKLFDDETSKLSQSKDASRGRITRCDAASSHAAGHVRRGLRGHKNDALTIFTPFEHPPNAPIAAPRPRAPFFCLRHRPSATHPMWPPLTRRAQAGARMRGYLSCFKTFRYTYEPSQTAFKRTKRFPPAPHKRASPLPSALLL